MKKASKKVVKKLDPRMFEQTPEELNKIEKEDEQERNPSLLGELTELVSEKVDLFHTPDNTAYVSFSENNRLVTVPIESDTFRVFLNRVAHESSHSLSKHQGDRLVDTLKMLAIYESEEHEVHMRVYMDRSTQTLWYHLGAEGFVEVNKEGWFVREKAPVKFRTAKQKLDQVKPVDGGSIDELFEILNVNNEVEKLLLKNYLVAVLVPDIARPILAVHGIQGSAKSTLQRIIKSLIDPSKADLCSFPNKQESLQILMNMEYMVCFDNMTWLNRNQSDELARTVTGQATANRQLYSNDGLVVFDYLRAICINGINLVATSPDLLDRCLLIELERLSDAERLTETQVKERFEEMKPRVLGAVFDLFHKALKLQLESPLEDPFRGRVGAYSEFCQYVTMAIGLEPEAFVEAYKENVNKQNDEAIKASPLAQAIMLYMKHRDEVKMQPSELYAELKELYPDSVPRAPHALSKALNALKLTLQSVGVGVELSREENRIIHLYKL